MADPEDVPVAGLSLEKPILVAEPVTPEDASERVVDSGEELSMVVRLASHPRGPHPEVAVPTEAVAADMVPCPDNWPGVSVVAPLPDVGPPDPVMQTSGVTVM